MKIIWSIHLPSCLLPQRWKIRRKSLKSGKGHWESTQPSPVVSDATSPRLANRLRRTRRILDFHSLSGNHIADDDCSPVISARSSLSSVNGFWPETCIYFPPNRIDAFFSIFQQPRACLAPEDGTKQEGGSFNNVSLSPSPPPVLRSPNKPLPCEYGKGKEEEESDESTLLWDEVDSPAIATCSLRGEEDFFFVCQQPWTCLPPVADPRQEDGSFIPRGKQLSILQDDNDSPSPSPPPVLRPRNRPMSCKLGKGNWEQESDELTIIWDEFDFPPVSPPPVLRPHNRPSPFKPEERNNDEESEESDESVIRAWVEDDSMTISPSLGLCRNWPFVCNLRKREDDEESDESTILWEEVPPSLRPRHRATTIPILTKGKGKWQPNKQEEETKEETKEDTKEDTKKETKEETKEDIFGWVVNSLRDTPDEVIWLTSGLNYPFEF